MISPDTPKIGVPAAKWPYNLLGATKDSKPFLTETIETSAAFKENGRS